MTLNITIMNIKIQTNMNSSTRLIKVLFCLVIFFGTFFILDNSASAAYSSLSDRQPVDDHQYINITDGTTGNGVGAGANLKDSYLKIYAQSDQERVVSVSLVDRGVGAGNACTGFQIHVFWAKLNSNEDVGIVGGPGSTIPGTQLPTLIPGTNTEYPQSQWNQIDTSGFGLCPFTYQFKIPAGNLTPSNVTAHEGLYVGEMRFLICSTTQPGFCVNDNHSGTFHVSVGGGAKIGFKGGRSATIYPSLSGASNPDYTSSLYNDNNKDDPAFNPPLYRNNHTIREEFRVPCSYLGSQVGPRWQDDDQRQPNQQNSIKLIVNGVAIPDSDVVWDGVTGASPGGYNINGVTPGKRYSLEFQRVWGGNGIALTYPYDSADFELPCPVAQAKCTLTMLTPWIPGTGDGILANSGYTVRATITNVGPTAIKEYPLGPGTATRLDLNTFQNNGPVPQQYIDYPGTINPGQTVTIDKNFFAPAGRNDNLVIGGNLRYPGYIDPIAGCGTISIDTYERYDFGGIAGTSYSHPEDPSSATFTSGFSKTGTADVDSTVTRSFYKVRNGVQGVLPSYNGTIQPNPGIYTFGNDPNRFVDTYAIPLGSNEDGDIYCVRIHMVYGHGWRGPNGYVNEREEAAQDCPATSGCPPNTVCIPNQPPVASYPYMRAYGADVVAGGGFTGVNSTCNSTDSGIYTFTEYLTRQRPTDASQPPQESNKSGSGAQLAAMALHMISGFTTASTRTQNPTLPRGLTFANINPATPNTTALDAPFGGKMKAGNGWCAPDYYNTTQFDDASLINVSDSSSPINLNVPSAIADKQQTKRNINNGKLMIQGTGSYDKHHTIYVDGDVFIQSSIKYKTPYTGGAASIPSFTLVVRGNIYINNMVDQLDGIYIAQPRPDGSKGRIYTCARNTDDPVIKDPTTLFQQCGAQGNGVSQLVVNGSFIAHKVVFNRTINSLRDSTYRESYDTSKAAEVIKYSPEILLSPPVFRPDTATSGEYNYLSTLPPIL